jgi:hypothetical protein
MEIDSDSLVQVQFQDKHYLGNYFPNSHLTLRDLKEAEKHLQVKLFEYCPNLRKKIFKLNIFPQTFVS